MPPLIVALLMACGGTTQTPEPTQPAPAVEPAPTQALTVADRVAQIRDLMDGVTDSDDEEEILAHFLAVRGADLFELKRGLDAGPTDEGLHHLVYSDIDDEAIRDSLKKHLVEAHVIPEPRPVRVISDIDDTILCRLFDKRYDKGITYPGVRAFYAEIGGGVTFLSARPADRVGAYETITMDMLEDRGFADFTLLHGTFVELRAHETMAEGKYRNFVQYRELYPEYAYVLTGDTGQADASFGAKLLAEFPEDVRGAFIHQLGNELTDVEHVDNLFYVETWAGAALHAHRSGWLTKEAAQRVIDSAQKELTELDFEEEQKRAVLADQMEHAATQLAD